MILAFEHSLIGSALSLAYYAAPVVVPVAGYGIAVGGAAYTIYQGASLVTGASEEQDKVEEKSIYFSGIKKTSENITKAVNNIEAPMDRSEILALHQVENQKNAYDDKYLNIILQRYEGDDKLKEGNVEKELQSFVNIVSESRVNSEQRDLNRA